MAGIRGSAMQRTVSVLNFPPAAPLSAVAQPQSESEPIDRRSVAVVWLDIAPVNPECVLEISRAREGIARRARGVCHGPLSSGVFPRISGLVRP